MIASELCTTLCVLLWLQPVGSQQGAPEAEQQLYTAVSSTSSWLDHVENALFSGPVLLTENPETRLQKQEVRSLKVTIS